MLNTSMGIPGFNINTGNEISLRTFESFTLERSIFIESQTFNDMYSKPFETEINLDTLDYLKNIVNSGQELTHLNLSNIAGTILKPTAVAESSVNIVNGWGERRFLFMLTFRESQGPNSNTRHLLIGYTDHAGISNLMGNQTSFDPNMKFFPNTHIVLVDTHRVNEYGTYTATTCTKNEQIVKGSTSEIWTPPNFNGNGNIVNPLLNMDFSTPAMTPSSNQKQFSLMPETVLTNRMVNKTINNFVSDELIDMGVDVSAGVTNTDATFETGVKLNNRANNTSHHYLSKTLSALSFARNSSFNDIYADGEIGEEEILSSARGVVQNSTIDNDPFLRYLHKHTRFLTTGHIDFSQFSSLFPNLDSITTILKNDNTGSMNANAGIMYTDVGRGSTEYWNVRTAECNIATTIANSLPTAMLTKLMGKVNFTASNSMGEWNIFAYEVKSYIDTLDAQDLIRQTELLKKELIYTLFIPLSMSGTRIIDLAINFNLSGGTFIKVSINGGAAIDFNFPTFADALTTPILTINKHRLDNLSNDIYNIANHLGFI